MKFELSELGLLINSVCGDILRDADSADGMLPKDDEYRWHYSPFLSGITNGEFVYCACQILTEMTSDEPPQPRPLYKEAILASILDCAASDFQNADVLDEEMAGDVWILWSAIRSQAGLPLWENKEEQAAEPPQLKDVTRREWEFILDVIRDELCPDQDWSLPSFSGNFAILNPQPYWPTFQEYRTARCWLLWAYDCIQP